MAAPRVAVPRHSARTIRRIPPSQIVLPDLGRRYVAATRVSTRHFEEPGRRERGDAGRDRIRATAVVLERLLAMHSGADDPAAEVARRLRREAARHAAREPAARPLVV